MDAIYKSEIDDLEAMAEYIAGDRLSNISDDVNLFAMRFFLRVLREQT